MEMQERKEKDTDLPSALYTWLKAGPTHQDDEICPYKVMSDSTQRKGSE